MSLTLVALLNLTPAAEPPPPDSSPKLQKLWNEAHEEFGDARWQRIAYDDKSIMFVDTERLSSPEPGVRRAWVVNVYASPRPFKRTSYRTVVELHQAECRNNRRAILGQYLYKGVERDKPVFSMPPDEFTIHYVPIVPESKGEYLYNLLCS